ncbi:50S ribosomal protein L12 [Agrococcus sp. SGAir0287]|uniref:50S ribosomal protein L12 n=1 Tax=Agrococcus sp. SGAir0287 TaxID=2070347 RepID=UPI0010CCEEA9|nr:50S ribosomal protein L12 [Agrococcus sp. SGAir0287]QCR18232.1 50S ribosomal protein L12 [Agrococcus sp. SGAir0287]
MTSEMDAAVAAAVAPLQQRIATLEQQLDWLFVQQGYQAPNGTIAAPATPPWPYPVSPAVVDLLREGRQIEAIKQTRAETGAGLAEAKELCDRTRAMLDAGV